jgi:dihydrodipicolinate synthase/N-acetylneuraminate lyase
MTDEQWAAEKEKRAAERAVVNEKWATDEKKRAAERAEKIEQMMRERLSKKFTSESDPSSTNKGARGLELRKDPESPLPSQPMSDEERAEKRAERFERMREERTTQVHENPGRTNDRGLSR